MKTRARGRKRGSPCPAARPRPAARRQRDQHVADPSPADVRRYVSTADLISPALTLASFALPEAVPSGLNVRGRLHGAHLLPPWIADPRRRIDADGESTPANAASSGETAREEA